MKKGEWEGSRKKRIHRGGSGAGAYYGASSGKAVGGTLPQYEETHLSRCEDGPDECLACAKIVSDREHERRIKDELRRSLPSSLPKGPPTS